MNSNETKATIRAGYENWYAENVGSLPYDSDGDTVYVKGASQTIDGLRCYSAHGMGTIGFIPAVFLSMESK